ncbi:MAG: hypothetical protein CME63_00220 [Halobacteriovoraceae bacterium]|nr:hypothetical protein [Halobacteriovoraceae bacterium]MBC96149.1 hypothetical protein [Halobacteriovoraceae bacterium]|tara:strand:+ start:17948 stop:18841 length:894 start_codon:yes stop_codon:yes gene_type:complete
MFKKLLFLIALLVQNAFAAQVYVEEVGGKEIGASEREAINEFIKSSVQNHSSYDLVDSKEGAQIILRPKLLKLSETYFLKISKIENGKVTKSSRMKSKKLSDIDRVTERLVESVLEGKSLEKTARVDNITDAEVKRNINRFEVTRQWFIGFGPGWLNSSNISKSGFFWKLGHEWGLDPNFSINLTLDGTSLSDSSADFTMFQMGLDYYFTLTKTSPYLGVGVGYGSSDAHGCTEDIFSFSCSDEHEAKGWAATINGGLKFFRTSAVNVGIEAEYAYIFDETVYGNPSRMTVSLAVYY